MNIGLHINNSTRASAPATADTIAQIAEIADQGGFSAISVMEHYLQMEHMFEPI